MLELEYPDGSTSRRPLHVLEKRREIRSLKDRIERSEFGKPSDLRRLLIFEKLKGNLHNVIYSMEAAQIDFYAYQFKPVLKFINSPTERLIIADEVGLGKTIESALIWMELQARREASRLLVICPSILTEKWKTELRGKFGFDARIAKFVDVKQEIEELKQNGDSHPCVLIASYEQMRSPRDELAILNESEKPLSSFRKTQFLWEMRHWKESFSHNAFDLVIFDEAHYMRNTETANWHLGKSLAAEAGAVLCVSATPIHNSNQDLRSLMRLIDEDFLTKKDFEELLEANEPAVQASNALAQTPVNWELLKDAIDKMSRAKRISDLPAFTQFQKLCKSLNPNDSAMLAEAEALAERLNLLGDYVNRTKRRQVMERRSKRKAMVLNVKYTAQEMRLYEAILKIVRQQCHQEEREFFIFRLLVRQLQAASCLPVFVNTIKNGSLVDWKDLLAESIDSEWDDDDLKDPNGEITNVNWGELKALMNYDFRGNDTKFAALIDWLRAVKEKVVIFSFYRKTLEYLYHRLFAEGISAKIIHGKVQNEDRWEALSQFQNPDGPQVLLSSEVGSEGIDLQFCRIIVNYDLPWNPMRIEQRIGRIDRVGQQAENLLIVNFKVQGTVEERLYERLHEKIKDISNSIGNFEAIVGEEIKKLTRDLLIRDLTPKEQAERIAETERVLRRKEKQERELEDGGTLLLAHSDYLQKQVQESHDRKRYIHPDELLSYVKDFFDREFRGCELHENTPEPGFLRIRLSDSARASLDDFIGNDFSPSTKPFRAKEFCLTFDPVLRKQISLDKDHKVHFANHQSPLIRWITKMNKERAHVLYDVSAILLRASQLSKSSQSALPFGDYCYRIERWKFDGIVPRKNLAYGVCALDGERFLDENQAEKVMQDLLQQGEDWDRMGVSQNQIIAAHKALERFLLNRSSAAMEEFETDNERRIQISRQRVLSYFDRRIANIENTLRTLREKGRGTNVIRATEGRLRVAGENKDRALRNVNKKKEVDFESSPVAAGVFRILE